MPLAGGRGEGEGAFTLTRVSLSAYQNAKKKQKISLKGLVVKKGKRRYTLCFGPQIKASS
jgi:hypothetical protein